MRAGVAGSETESFEGDAVDDSGAVRRPGVVAVFSGGRACCRAFPLAGQAIELGRDELAAVGIADTRVSRSHVRIERDNGLWTVRDLGSRNGTFVDARPAPSARQRSPVVRVGCTLLLPVDDCRPFESPGVTVRREVVMGPALQAVHERIAAGAPSGANLLIQGESGAGKELAARAFHEACAMGAMQRPFVAINCATIPKDLAERVLFGARRGAYTGAVTDATGLLQSADRGTLFLDEIAELNPNVQGKLLRVLETQSVTPLGSVQAVSINVRICAATLKNLRVEVAAGRFREDLYFRIGRPTVRLPPLRERREEMPWLIERALGTTLGASAMTASVEFVEACLLREWPGNVRELVAETTTAVVAATANNRTVIAVSDLDDEAGHSLVPPPPAALAESAEGGNLPAQGYIEAALSSENGNVARAAARLAMSRGRLRRYIERLGIDVRALRSS